MFEVDLLSYDFASGTNAGKHLASLLIAGEFPYWHSYFKQLDAKSCDNKNKLHLALEYQINLLLKLRPKMICPHCGKQAVALVGLHDNGGWFNSINFHKHVCCRSQKCKQSVKFFADTSLLREIDFNLYYVKSRFGNKRQINQSEVTKLLQLVFELPKNNNLASDLTGKNQVVDYLIKNSKNLRVKIPKAS